jgi:hypothetical protein
LETKTTTESITNIQTNGYEEANLVAVMLDWWFGGRTCLGGEGGLVDGM